MDPVIEWYESSDATVSLASLDFGLVDAGARSPAKRLFVFNNKGGTGAQTATDLRYTTYDDDGGAEGDVVAQRWLEVRVVSHDGDPAADPDGGFKAVGGPEDRHKKDLQDFPLASGQYLEVEARVAVPREPAPGSRAFVQRLEFKFV